MSESPLMIKSKAFALEVIRACKVLREARCESALINQFLRSGTSIGANIAEAQRGQSTPDFATKMCIALKEANETETWLNVLFKSGSISEPTFKFLRNKCGKIRRMLIASITTVKSKMNGQK